eukprot:12892997-Alexandrium_andersonii.AAC.1
MHAVYGASQSIRPPPPRRPRPSDGTAASGRLQSYGPPLRSCTAAPVEQSLSNHERPLVRMPRVA